MNIDRHNYEMYFLLYVDNELSAEVRHAVEKFVGENNDLAAELELLIQTALPAEEIVFNSKQHLYKKELKAGYLQEQMLLYLDDELEPLPMNALSAEIAANDDLEQEWNILQKTKLDPNENIVFENKELLYRDKKDRVIPIFFWRAAAAILILGTTIFIGVEKFSGNETRETAETFREKGRESSNKPLKPAEISTAGKENNVVKKQANENLALTQQTINNTSVKENDIQQQEKNIVSNLAKEKNNTAPKRNVTNTTGGKKSNEKFLVQKENNNLPKPYYENINNPDRNKTASSTVQDNIKILQNKNEDEKTQDKEIAISKIKESQIPVEDIALTQTGSSQVNHAVLNVTNSETGNNSILFVSEDKLNRSKLGGFFRKVKRVVSRNANINTGNSVKIAGFEIATR